MSIIKKIFAILLIFSFAVLSAGVLYPVKNRKANAVIVIPPDADRVEKFAAKELQEHIRELTGATLVVVSAKSDGKINIFLGSKFASVFPEDLKKLVQAAAEASELATALPSVKFTLSPEFVRTTYQLTRS